MAKEPDERYQTAKEMADALTEVIKQLKLDAEAKTDQLATDELRESLASKVILPSEKNFIPVSTNIRIPSQVSAPKSKKPIFNAIIAFFLGVIAIFLSISFFNKPRNRGSESPPRITEAILYDDFDNGAYESGVNDEIWLSDIDPACILTQKDGVLVISNEKMGYDMDDCDLSVASPNEVKISSLETLQAKILFEGGYDGVEAGQSLMIGAELDEGGSWYALCGAELVEGEAVASLWVAHIAESGLTNENYYASVDIKPDTWYTYRLKVDPATGVFSCSMDDALVGSTALEDSEKISFTRGLTAWRSANTQAITKVDDFWLLP